MAETIQSQQKQSSKRLSDEHALAQVEKWMAMIRELASGESAFRKN